MTNVIDEIRAERERQVQQEGWTPEHDDGHDRGQLAKAAATYAIHSTGDKFIPIFSGRHFLVGRIDATEMAWPWQGGFKPKDCRHDLIRAAALIVAEIERLDRAVLQSKEATQ